MESVLQHRDRSSLPPFAQAVAETLETTGIPPDLSDRLGGPRHRSERTLESLDLHSLPSPTTEAALIFRFLDHLTALDGFPQPTQER